MIVVVALGFDMSAWATSALAVLGFVSLLVAGVVGRASIRSANASRQAQTFLQIYPWFRSNRAYRGRQLLKTDFAKLDDVEHQLVQEVYGYYELLAIYVDSGYIDERVARKMFSGTLRVAADRVDEWLKHHEAGNANLYAVHLRAMVARWPATTEDAMPNGALLHTYKGATSPLTARVRDRWVRFLGLITSGASAVERWASGNRILAAVALALAVTAALRRDAVGLAAWGAALVAQAFLLVIQGRRRKGR